MRPREQTEDSAGESATSSSDDDEGDGAQDDTLSSDDDADSDTTRKPALSRRVPAKSDYTTCAPTERRELEEKLAALNGRLRDARDELASMPQPEALTVTMHGYQLDGLRWAAALHRCEASGLLCDEMGLGKTLQAIAMLVHLRERGSSNPFLVVAPLSTLAGWREQLAAFAPSLTVATHAGSAAERADALSAAAAQKADVVVSSYEAVLRDAPALKRFAWDYAVLDEAHRLKNSSSLAYRCLLDELRLGTTSKLLLTGTPLQNCPSEFFALLHFACPELYDNESGFVEWLVADGASGSEGDGGSTVRQLWEPLLLRRLKATHLALPPKHDISLGVPLTPLQRKWYLALLERNLHSLGAAPDAARSLVFVLGSLRKVCGHPYLFPGVEPEPFEEGEHLVAASAKVALLDRLLLRLRRRGDRVLLYSGSTQMLDILQDVLTMRRLPYVRLDGSARAEERFAAIADFRRRGGGDGGDAMPPPFCFLLSTRAGGVGLNLVEANTVIFFDPDWNPMVERQAADRAHRLGQSRPVTVFHLFCRDTVEEVIRRRCARKASFADSLLREHSAAAADEAGPTGREAAEAIRFGVHELRAAKPDSDVSVGDDELDAILSRIGSDESTAKAAEAVAAGADATDESVYVFEGKNFSRLQRGDASAKQRDVEALEALRVSSAAGPSDAAETRKRRRGAPMEEALNDDAEKVRRAEVARQRKQERWRKAGYASLALPLPTTTEEDCEGASEPAGLSYAVGDAALAGGEAQGGSGKPAFVLCMVDASGRWPNRGFFRAISAVSDAPESAYVAAAEQKDLKLGDAHLVPLVGMGGSSSTATAVCLLVVMKRPRDAHAYAAPVIDDAALSAALAKVAGAASASGASVHSPRTLANWYATERCLKKQLARLRVPTTIYYYKRS